MATGKFINWIILFLAASCSTMACASGSEAPEDYFVLRTRPDIQLSDYQAGQLGIIQANYPRLFLYPAWRAIMLGNAGLSKDRIEAGALERFCCSQLNGWSDENNSPRQQWQAIRASITDALPNVKLSPPYDEADPYRYYSDCTDESYQFATATLTHLKQRPEATPALLKQWVAAQDQVYEMCGYPNHMSPPDVPAMPELPAALPNNTGAIWLQYREYQTAAAAFYTGQHKLSFELFNKIAQQENHPMQHWGAYLALRSKIREITLRKQPQLILKTGDGVLIFPEDLEDDQMAEIEQLAQNIIKNPKFIVVHEITRASLRAFKYRATPRKQFAALSTQLNNYQTNPYENDVLGDWRRLANNYFDHDSNGKNTKTLLPAMRKQYEFFDWIVSIKGCGDNQPNCAQEAQHAYERWQQASNTAQKRTWLVATLMTAQQINEELEQHARQVSSNAPEYLTVQYHLARLLRLAARPQKAQKILDTLLNQTTGSTRNLLLQERFASATSLKDASLYLMRQAAGSHVWDSQHFSAALETNPQIDTDGRYWINQSLSIKDLLQLGSMEHIPTTYRSKLTQMAWARAHLLDQIELSKQAAEQVANLNPALSDLVKRYLQSDNDLVRNQVLFLAAIDYGVSVTLDINPTRSYHNLCCSLEQTNKIPPYLPTTPEVSQTPQLRDNEIIALHDFRLGGAHFARHLLDYVKAYPQDPDNPRLLATVIRANKHWENCETDRETCANLVQKCFTLLHKQYGKSKWAQETKYWYK